jgi:hypothetical protein
MVSFFISIKQKYEKRLRKERKNMFGLPIKQNICKFSARVWTRSTVTSWVRSNGPTDPLHISCICSIWKILHFYSSAAKDTIFWQKKTQSYRYQNYCPGWQYSNLFIWPSMWTRLEHAHCLETLNNMWFLGKRESVNSWNKAYLLQHNLVLIFILWRSVRKTTIILGMKKITILVDNIPLRPFEISHNLYLTQYYCRFPYWPS